MPFLSLGDAMRSHVADGDCVAMEGFTHLIPFAAMRDECMTIAAARMLHNGCVCFV